MIDVGCQTRSCNLVSLPVGATQPLIKRSRPRNITILCLTLLGVFILSIVRDLIGGEAAVWGPLCCGGVFLVFATLHFPDGVFVRPSQGFWRLVKGATLLYLLILVYLLFQNIANVIDREQTIEKSYGTTCKIYDPTNTDNPWHGLIDKLDIFVAAHFLGWMAKALIIRDWTLLWTASIVFELSEVILRHKLPNFVECWWDFLLLDVLGCNLLGMVIGMRLCNRFRMKIYQWGSQSTLTSHRCNWRDIFLPFVFTEYSNIEWFSTHQRFLTLCIIVCFTTIFDLNFFLLKSILKLDPGHWICISRTLVVGLASCPAVAEVHAFITEDRHLCDSPPSRAALSQTRRLGVQAWLLMAVLTCESLLILRWAPDGIPNHHVPAPPSSIIVGCSLFGSIVGIYVYLLSKQKIHLKKSA